MARFVFFLLFSYSFAASAGPLNICQKLFIDQITPLATVDESYSFTVKVNKAWKKWLSETGQNQMSGRTNRELVENLKEVNPEFYKFLEFISPEFLDGWSEFSTLQENYIRYQKMRGRPNSELYRMVIPTKTTKRNQMMLSSELPSPHLIDYSPVPSLIYLQQIMNRQVVVEYGPLPVKSTENFSLLHDLAHAFVLTQTRYVDSLFKMIPKIIENLQKSKDDGFDKKWELLSMVLEDYWELESTDRLRLDQLVKRIQPIMAKVKLFYKTHERSSNEPVVLLSVEESMELKNTFLLVRQLLREARIIRFGAAVTEGVAIDRSNYGMDRHGNPNTIFQYIHNHPFFHEASEVQVAGKLHMTVFYFIDREYSTLIELQTRSLDREVQAILDPLSE
jgi:hypothetical protein